MKYNLSHPLSKCPLVKLLLRDLSSLIQVFIQTFLDEQSNQILINVYTCIKNKHLETTTYI